MELFLTETVEAAFLIARVSAISRKLATVIEKLRLQDEDKEDLRVSGAFLKLQTLTHRGIRETVVVPKASKR